MESIPEEVQKFRREWLPKVPRWYSARWHYFGTTAISFPLIAFGLIKAYHTTLTDPFQIWELLAIPFFFLSASFVEYIVHRYPLHRKLPLGNLAFTQHTLRHHQYYTDEAIEALQAKEYHLVLFPFWGVALIQYAVNLPFSILIGSLLGERIGMLGLVVGVFFFFVYETVHAICHFPAGAELFKITLFYKLKEHHRIHHRKGLMSKVNFNIVYPTWDWLLGTKSP